MGKPHKSMQENRTIDQMKAANEAFADDATDLTNTWINGIKKASIKHYGNERGAVEYVQRYISIVLRKDMSWVINRWLEVEIMRRKEEKAKKKTKLHTVARDNKKT
jgi:hypothetical protein